MHGQQNVKTCSLKLKHIFLAKLLDTSTTNHIYNKIHKTLLQYFLLYGYRKGHNLLLQMQAEGA